MKLLNGDPVVSERKKKKTCQRCQKVNEHKVEVQNKVQKEINEQLSVKGRSLQPKASILRRKERDSRR